MLAKFFTWIFGGEDAVSERLLKYRAKRQYEMMLPETEKAKCISWQIAMLNAYERREPDISRRLALQDLQIAMISNEGLEDARH